MSVDVNTIGVGVDTKQLKAGARDLDSFGRSADNASRKADGFNAQAEKAAKSSSALSSSLGLAGRALGVFGAAAGIGGFIRSADAITKMEAQLSNATKSQAEFNQALANTQKIATTAQADISAIGTTYARLSNALQDLGANQKQVASVAETLALALKVNGATAAETSSVMLQLSQAFGKGKLDGDEFRSAMENMPALMRELAKSMGVPFGALKDLAAQGGITSDVLLKAFSNPEYLKALQKQAVEMKTITGGWEVFTNQLVIAIGKINEATGASRILVGVLEGAATLLSVFQGGEQGSILRNYLDKRPSQKDLSGDSIASLRGLSGGGRFGGAISRQAKDELARRLKSSGVTAFGGNIDSSSYAPNFSSTTEAQDINKIHQAQEAAQAKFDERQRKSDEAQKKAQDALTKQKLGAQQLYWDTEARKYDQTIKRIVEEDKLKEKQYKEREEAAQKYFEFEERKSKEAQRMRDEAAEKIKRQYEEIADFLGSRVSGAITEGIFKGGSRGARYLKEIFSKLILEPLLKPLTSGLAGALQGIFGDNSILTGKGDGSIFGQISGIGDLFKKGNSSIVSSIEWLGSFLSTGTGGLGDKIGGFLGKYAGGISKVLPFAGAAFSLLKGDIKGAIGSGIGAALSFTPLGPIGGIIGSLLGGGLFGNKKIKRYGTTVSGAYDGTEYKDIGRSKFYDRDIGAGDALSSLNKTFADSFSYFLKGFDLNSVFSISSSQYQRGKSKKAGGFFSGEIDGKSFGGSVVGKKLSPEAVFGMLTEKLLGQGLADAIRASSASEGVKKFFAELTKKEDVAEVINTLVGLNKQLAELPPVFNAIRNAIDTTEYTTSIADLKARFAAVGTYTSLFYTEQEQFDTFTKQITRQFDELNTALPKSRDEYRALVDGLTVTDESTSDLFHGLVALAPAMDAYFKQLEAQKAQVDAATNSLRDLNSFTSLAEYRNYRGVAANYGTTTALDFTANSRSGAIRVGADGKANASGNTSLVALLTEIRDLTKQTLTQTADGTSLLQTFDRVGMPTRA